MPVDFNCIKKVSSNRKELKFAEKKDDKGNKDQGKEDKQEKNKKIDFKEKAIKAKENAMKKMLAKHTNGGGVGPNQGANKKKSNSFQKTIESITN